MFISVLLCLLYTKKYTTYFLNILQRTEWFGSKSCQRNFYDKNMDDEAYILFSSNSAQKKFFHIHFVLITSICKYVPFTSML